VTTASAAKRTYDAAHEYRDSASSLPGSIHDSAVSTSISANDGTDSDLMLAGSVRRSCRRTARRTARRTSRRQERRDDD
jgi:hypothetical protein